MSLIRDIVFSYEAVREWEAKFTPAMAEVLRRRGKVGRSWYVGGTYFDSVKLGGDNEFLLADTEGSKDAFRLWLAHPVVDAGEVDERWCMKHGDGADGRSATARWPVAAREYDGLTDAKRQAKMSLSLFGADEMSGMFGACSRDGTCSDRGSHLGDRSARDPWICA